MEALMASDRCEASVYERACLYRAKVVIDGKSLCTQHAAVAARRAAEAARKAAFWEEMFAPRPNEPYRTDPEWQAATRAMLSDDRDDDAIVRRIDAIYRRRDIEARWEA
jgi:hypothetical protein